MGMVFACPESVPPSAGNSDLIFFGRILPPSLALCASLGLNYPPGPHGGMRARPGKSEPTLGFAGAAGKEELSSVAFLQLRDGGLELGARIFVTTKGI